MDASGRVLAPARLPGGVAGMARLHELAGRYLGENAGEAEVAAGIGTGRGPWVAALAAAGYVVYAVNPLQASRYRERHRVPGAKSGRGGARMPADVVRTGSHPLRPVAGASADAEGIKVLARARKTLLWEPTRQLQRPRHQPREYFPAALGASGGLAAAGALGLLGKAPGPARAAGLTRAQVPAVLTRARRHHIAGKTTAIVAALRGEQLSQPPARTAAYAAAVRSLIAVITTLNEQVKTLQGQVGGHFGRHPDAEIYLSQPGMGAIAGARVLAESGGDPHRYTSAKARKNYAATSPITRASGKKKLVAARYTHTGRLTGALMAQAFPALKASPGARAFYDGLRARAIEHNDALRRLSNRLAGILHGCLKTRTLYNEATAWSHREKIRPAA